ncbi:MAG: tetratricopeptide repeat protein [Thermodesulfobacteriota bacterium]
MKQITVVCALCALSAVLPAPSAWAQSKEEGISLFNQALQLQKTAKSSQDLDRVLETYRKALAIFERLNFHKGIGLVANNMAMVYGRRGDYDRALELYAKSRAIEWKLGDTAGEENTLNNMGKRSGGVRGQ